MAEIHLHREHRLGLAKARKTAWRWAELVEEKFGMECTVIEGEDSDVVEFTRTGVDGKLVVTGDAFELDAQRGSDAIADVAELLFALSWPPAVTASIVR